MKELPMLVIYDMRKGMQKNPRRVEFTKGLYGYYYAWDTKVGRKRRRKMGLIDEFEYDKVGDSAILVLKGDIAKLFSYFQRYSDVIAMRAFQVSQEVALSSEIAQNTSSGIMAQTIHIR